MYIDNKFLIVLSILFVLCLSACDRSQAPVSQPPSLSPPNPASSALNPDYIDLHTIDDSTIEKMLSGIWYKKQRASSGTSIDRTFSWGKTTIDVENALCIDLLGGNNKLFFIDVGWDIEFKKGEEDRKVVFITLKTLDGKEMGKIFARFSSDGGMLIKYDSESTAEYILRLNGTYYKSVPTP